MAWETATIIKVLQYTESVLRLHRMKANDVTLSEILDSSYQYLIPVFQRFYSWEKENWKELWEDIEDLRDLSGPTESHFLGSLVFVSKDHPGKDPVYQVIDGQQRLITLSLLLCALRDAAGDWGMDQMRGKINDNYLVRPYESDNDHFRVFPRMQDREEYKSIVLGNDADSNSAIQQAYAFFRNRIEQSVGEDAKGTIDNLLSILKQRIDFVQINLDAGENPFQIFSSLNSTGVDLGEGDLIRNFVFMHVDLEDQDSFDTHYWAKLENIFQGENDTLNDGVFSSFFRHYLLKEGSYVPKNSTFKAFEDRYADAFDPRTLTEELIRYGEYYQVIRGEERHENDQVTSALAKLNDLNSSTTYPLLLKLVAQEDEDQLSAEDLAATIESIASFILRRFVCSESSRTYYRWFTKACNKVDDDPRGNVRDYLVSKGYPDDGRFQKQFLTFELYKSNYNRPVLKALERSSEHREAPDLSETEIEHIVPQTLSAEWKVALGKSVEEVEDVWMHTPGNLTLSAYNKELFNHSFGVKKSHYEKSNVSLNRELCEYDEWGKKQIVERGKNLAETAKSIWPSPSI